MYRVLQRGPLWLDSECGTNPPSPRPSWTRHRQTITLLKDLEMNIRRGRKSRNVFLSFKGLTRFIVLTHLAERVMVMSDTSIFRQFSTLSRTGLLTCWCSGGKGGNISVNKTCRWLSWRWGETVKNLNQCTFIPDRDKVFLSLYFPSCCG